MQELDGIDLPDGRRGTVVYVRANALLIIVEVGPGLVDYGVEENGLKKFSRMTVGPEDLVNRLVEGKKGAEAADVQK